MYVFVQVSDNWGPKLDSFLAEGHQTKTDWGVDCMEVSYGFMDCPRAALGMRSCFNIQQEVDVKLCNPRLKTVKKFYFFFKIIIAMKMLIQRDI